MNLDLSPRGLNKHEPFAVNQILPLIEDYAAANGLTNREAVVLLFLALANVTVVPTHELAWAVAMARPVPEGHRTLQ
jgi:hypothetical protein